MNKLDKQYTDLLQDILDNGVVKGDRTGTGTISVFGRQIRHNMKDGFPLLTTKEMAFKSIVTELLWFLRGDTNIKYLVDNRCNIWNGDAYKNYLKNWEPQKVENDENPMSWMDQKLVNDRALPQDMFIHCIKTNDEFAKKWGELGPIYGKQWRQWSTMGKGQEMNGMFTIEENMKMNSIDQIQNLINELKTNPDSRRLMVNAWNVGELDQMVLPPCHYGFQVYTRELSLNDRILEFAKRDLDPSEFRKGGKYGTVIPEEKTLEVLNKHNIPTRAISLMWNQRSVDTFLGLPFNIASYGLLLEIIAKEVNMVPDQLIGNLGDVHLYSNHIDAAKEQIGGDISFEGRVILIDKLDCDDKTKDKFKNSTELISQVITIKDKMKYLDRIGVPNRTREPFPLPTFDCPVIDEIPHTTFDELVFKLQSCDFYMDDYKSHPTIKAPLSN